MPGRSPKVWRPKVKSQVQGVDAPAKEAEAPVNMVFLLPREFSSLDINESEEGASTELVLDPQQAVFDKPVGVDHLHLKALYLHGFVNGKPMSKMMGRSKIRLVLYIFVVFESSVAKLLRLRNAAIRVAKLASRRKIMAGRRRSQWIARTPAR